MWDPILAPDPARERPLKDRAGCKILHANYTACIYNSYAGSYYSTRPKPLEPAQVCARVGSGATYTDMPDNGNGRHDGGLESLHVEHVSRDKIALI